MRKYFFLILVSIVCISCIKKDVVRTISIDVNLKDDVSPVEGEISIPGQFDYIEWTFEEIYKPIEDSPNPTTHVFSTKCPAKVEVIAYNNDRREKHIGNTEISIPDVAKKIKLSGFYFVNLEGANPYNQKQISISITYLKLGTANTQSFSLLPKNLSPTDTIYFPEPVIYDINGFENGGFSDYEIFIKINPNSDLEFLSSFNLTGVYLSEHSSNPNTIYVSNVKQNQINTINLVCDRQPS